MAERHKEAVRRALAFLALPGNAGLAVRSLYRTVDAIWWACGDRSTDFNFYTKRGLLAAVYSSTLLYWLDDGSDGHADSWAFLDRRIADVMRLAEATADGGPAMLVGTVVAGHGGIGRASGRGRGCR